MGHLINLFNLVRRPAQLLQHPLRALRKRAARFGERDPLFAAQQKLRAEGLLQLTQRPAERRLRLAQFSCRRTDAAAARHLP